MAHPLTEPLRANGEWTIYAGGQPLPGELVYDPDGGLHLSLMGRFADLDPPADGPGLDSVERLITGVTPSMAISLYGCTQTRVGWTGPTVYRANWAVLGGHPDEPGPLVAARVRARIPLLDAWLPTGGLSTEMAPAPEVGDTAYSIQLERVPEVVIEPDWGTVSIKQRCKTVDPAPTGPRVASVHEWFDIDLEFPNEVPIETLLNERVDAVLDFATLMTGYTADLERLAIICDVHRDNGNVHQEEFDVLYSRAGVGAVDLTTVDDEHFLLDPRLADAPSVADLLGCWLEVRQRFRRPVAMLFGAQRSPRGTYTEVRFLTLCHGAEALHRDRHPDASRIPADEWAGLKAAMLERVDDERLKTALREQLHHANDMTLIDRLKALHDYAFDTDSEVIDTAILLAIKDARNKLVHSSTKKLRALPQSDRLYYLGEYITLLIKACLLRELDLTADQVAHTIRSSPTYRHLQRSFTP